MEIIWSEFAIKNLKDIFDYYSNKVSNKVAHKIRKQILNSTKQLPNNPKSGQLELNLKILNLNHRYLISGNYKIIYRIDQNKIIINDVFDTRQNPLKMNNKNRI